MATQVQFRRGTTTQNNAFTGANGEISVDTDIRTLRLHDGTTGGGSATLMNTTTAQTALNKTFSSGSVWTGTAVALAYGGTGSSLTAVQGAVAYSGASGFGLSAAGTSGQVLVSGGTGSPVWVNASSLTTGTATVATTATNIAGGSAGQLVIQSDVGLSAFITAGASGTFLQSAGAGYAPTWAAGQVTIGSTAVALGATVTSFTGLNILTATGTSHWLLPVGNTAQRPVTPATGMVRYNTTTVGFEGYSSGAWSSLGGVSSVDKFTYIQAETSAGASNGELEFFAEDAAGTAATKVAGMNRTRLLEATGTVLGTQTTQNLFNTVATTLNIGGAATAVNIGAATGTLTLGNVTITATNATSLALNGASPAITTTSTTASVFNSTVTTLNIGGAATTLSIGAATGTATINNANVVITGNLTVNGTTTTVNSTTLTVDDKNIELGSVASPTDVTAEGGGITLKGAADKTILWGAATGWQTEDGFVTRRAFSGTTSSTTATAMLAIPTATYRSGELTIQVVNATAYRILKLFFVHDGTNVTLSENYLNGGEVQTAATNTTFTASISAGTLTIFATAASGTAAIDGDATLFKV